MPWKPQPVPSARVLAAIAESTHRSITRQDLPSKLAVAAASSHLSGAPALVPFGAPQRLLWPWQWNDGSCMLSGGTWRWRHAIAGASFFEFLVADLWRSFVPFPFWQWGDHPNLTLGCVRNLLFSWWVEWRGLSLDLDGQTNRGKFSVRIGCPGAGFW